MSDVFGSSRLCSQVLKRKIPRGRSIDARTMAVSGEIRYYRAGASAAAAQACELIAKASGFRTRIQNGSTVKADIETRLPVPRIKSIL
jgi:hypothetical protein